MTVKPSKVSDRKPSDKLLGTLAEDLLDSGNKLSVETLEARYEHWSGAAWRRLYDVHLETANAQYKERHGHELFEATKGIRE